MRFEEWYHAIFKGCIQEMFGRDVDLIRESDNETYQDEQIQGLWEMFQAGLMLAREVYEGGRHVCMADDFHERLKIAVQAHQAAKREADYPAEDSNTTIWMVFQKQEYEPDRFIAVFNTRQGAAEHIKQLIELGYGESDFYYEPWELNRKYEGGSYG